MEIIKFKLYWGEAASKSMGASSLAMVRGEKGVSGVNESDQRGLK
jgi:hypothetical protein